MENRTQDEYEGKVVRYVRYVRSPVDGVERYSPQTRHPLSALKYALY